MKDQYPEVCNSGRKHRRPLKYLKDIVDDYIRRKRENAKKELRWFKIQKTLKRAIELAALARKPSGKKFSHQYRIPNSSLLKSANILLQLEDDIKRCKDFDELYELVEAGIKPLPKIGNLTVYDTVFRIGAHLNLYPEQVYLHRGTRDGARIFIKDARKRKTILVDELPVEFGRLLPHEVEDCLCIYKDALQRISN